jgi:hypothetical protein
MSIQLTETSLPTKRLNPVIVLTLNTLTPGVRIRVIQTVRVGAKKWETNTTGVFRGVHYLATGITTERVAQDDIVVPTVHFTKDNGELASIALDENTKIEKI